MFHKYNDIFYRVHMDGSKQEHGIGAEVYIAETETKMSIKLPHD